MAGKLSFCRYVANLASLLLLYSQFIILNSPLSVPGGFGAKCFRGVANFCVKLVGDGLSRCADNLVLIYQT